RTVRCRVGGDGTHGEQEGSSSDDANHLIIPKPENERRRRIPETPTSTDANLRTLIALGGQVNSPILATPIGGRQLEVEPSMKHRPLRRLLGALAVLSASSFRAACSDRPPPPNVLLITVDTLRPDALGFVNGRADTPAIDAL